MQRYSFLVAAGLACSMVAPWAMAGGYSSSQPASAASGGRPVAVDPPVCKNPADCVAHGSSVPINSGKR